MKRMIILLFSLSSLCLFADVIYLKTGDKISGTVISETNDVYNIKTSFGDLSIEKEKIKEITPDPPSSLPSFQHNAKQNVPMSQAYKQDFSYVTYKKYLGIGLGFLIPGLVFTTIPAIFITPAVVDCMFRTPFVPIAPIASYFTCISIGVILDLISIPFLFTADKYYKKNLEKYQVRLNGGIGKDSVEVALNISF